MVHHELELMPPAVDLSKRLPFRKAEVESSLLARWRRVVQAFPLECASSDSLGQQCTYQQLDSHCMELAADVLTRMGPANRPVALVLDHSPQMLTGILGALHANKAYVALDPCQPMAQLQKIYSVIGSPLIISETANSRLAEALADGAAPVSYLDQLAVGHDPLPPLDLRPDAMAGIFFTSGTTGRPRGIVRTHRTILHRIWCNAQQLKYVPGKQVSGIYQCGLGGGVADVFNALLNGATYCAYHFQSLGLSGFSSWLQTNKINSLRLPIVLFRQWLDSLEPSDFFPYLEHVIPSGPKTRSDIERLWPHVSETCQVWTSYAATETTQVCCSSLTRFSKLQPGTLHVGKPLPDKTVTVVSDDGSPAAIGEIGQIVVRSRYIATEYWQQPELSRQRFQPADDPAESIFFTGDYGRQCIDGNLEITGRRDSQIKIRGYRVDLHEVEDALRELPAVSEAAVMWDAPSERLIAYVVAACDPPANYSAVREALANRLANYAVPAKLVYLPSMPLLASGKIDRQRLGSPGRQRPDLASGYVAPTSTLETQLASLWGDILDVEPIGIYDSFFDLGGDSLRMARLLMHVQQTQGRQIPLAGFFEHPNIAYLARTLRAPILSASSQLPQQPWQHSLQIPSVSLNNQGVSRHCLLKAQESTASAAQLTATEASLGKRNAPPLQVNGHGSTTESLPAELGSVHELLEQAHQIPWHRQAGPQLMWNRRSRFLRLCGRLLGPRFSCALLDRLTACRGISRRIFADKQLTIRRFIESIDTSADVDQTIACSLYYYLVERYGIDVSTGDSPFTFTAGIRQTRFEGQAILDELRMSGRGVLLVRSHDRATHWFRSLGLADYRVGGIRHLLRQLRQRGPLDEQALFSQQLSQACYRLARGQVVEIHGDGYDGTSAGIEHEFHGVRRRFLAGFAELALLSNAAVFVVDCRLYRPLTAHIRLHGPLDAGPSTMPHAERVAWLVNQYVDCLRGMWADRPWQVPLSEMDSYFATSRCSE